VPRLQSCLRRRVFMSTSQIRTHAHTNVQTCKAQLTQYVRRLSIIEQMCIWLISLVKLSLKHTHTLLHNHTFTRAHTHTLLHIHTSTRAHTNTYTHANTRTHASVHAQACEIFILELTLKAWRHAEENKRRTLQRNDVSAAITRTDIFDFLVRFV